MKRLLALALAFAAGVSGCGSAGPAPTPAPAPKDKAVTPERASELGAPPLDKAWGPQDIVAFEAFVDKLPTDEYPLATGSGSTPLFKKFLDSVEQPMLADKAVPVKDRMEQGLVVQRSVNEVLKKYAYANGINGRYARELACLQGVSLAIVRQLMVPVDDFMPTIDPNDGKYAVRMDGLRKMKNGMTMELEGLLLSLAERQFYKVEERRIMAQYLSENVHVILDHLDADYRPKFEAKVREHLASEPDEAIKNILAKVFVRTPPAGKTAEQ